MGREDTFHTDSGQLETLCHIGYGLMQLLGEWMPRIDNQQDFMFPTEVRELQSIHSSADAYPMVQHHLLLLTACGVVEG